MTELTVVMIQYTQGIYGNDSNLFMVSSVCNTIPGSCVSTTCMFRTYVLQHPNFPTGQEPLRPPRFNKTLEGVGPEKLSQGLSMGSGAKQIVLL